MPEDIPLHPVESTCIRAAGYDPAQAALRLLYVSGGLYDYFDVAAEVYDTLLAAPSKGRFVNAEVKPRFPYRRLN